LHCSQSEAGYRLQDRSSKLTREIYSHLYTTLLALCAPKPRLAVSFLASHDRSGLGCEAGPSLQLRERCVTRLRFQVVILGLYPSFNMHIGEGVRS
jgi:hypothetical protein